MKKKIVTIILALVMVISVPSTIEATEISKNFIGEVGITVENSEETKYNFTVTKEEITEALKLGAKEKRDIKFYVPSDTVNWTPNIVINYKALKGKKPLYVYEKYQTGYIIKDTKVKFDDKGNLKIKLPANKEYYLTDSKNKQEIDLQIFRAMREVVEFKQCPKGDTIDVFKIDKKYKANIKSIKITPTVKGAVEVKGTKVKRIGDKDVSLDIKVTLKDGGSMIYTTHFMNIE